MTPDIRRTPYGYVWITDDELHELYVPSGAVHVTKKPRDEHIVLGDN